MINWSAIAPRSTLGQIVRLDCEYIEHWSLWLDLSIIAQTVRKVLRADGW